MELLPVSWKKSMLPEFSDGKGISLFYGDEKSVFPFLCSDFLTEHDGVDFLQEQTVRSAMDMRRKARALLRFYCSLALDIPPQKIRFGLSESGKPYLPDAHLYFSVSHTDHAFLVAFSTSGELGVDMESPAELPDMQAVMAYAFSASEINFVAGAADHEERLTRFYMVWTAKEALLKAVGCGLSGLQQACLFNIQHLSPGIAFTLHSFLTPGGLIAGLAAGEKEVDGHFYYFSPANTR